MEGVTIRQAEGKGRGVFATQPFAPKDIIEVAPVTVLSPADTERIGATDLYDYYFSWEGDKSAIVWGYGSIYNHSYVPNADYEKDFQNRRVIFRAIKQITAGEEIMTNYNGDPSDTSPLWFDVYQG